MLNKIVLLLQEYASDYIRVIIKISWVCKNSKRGARQDSIYFPVITFHAGYPMA